MTTVMGVVDKASGRIARKEVTIAADEGIRPDTTLEALRKIRSAMPGGVITAGNASQFSDGSSACVLMNAKLAEKRGLQALGVFRGFAVAGCESDEMGIGPVFAIPRLVERPGVKMKDIGLWELNEAFAVQVLYCRDKLGIPDELLNVNGGAIAVGHPYGVTAFRLTGHALIEGKRRRAKYVVVTDVHRWRPGRCGPVRSGLMAADTGCHCGLGSRNARGAQLSSAASPMPGLRYARTEAPRSGPAPQSRKSWMPGQAPLLSGNSFHSKAG